MSKFVQEFKEFATRGNVIDMAVGIIIGAAFTSIVTSLVNDIVMPLISLLTGGIDYSAWKITLGVGEQAATLNYGNFLNAVINFLLVALVIFCMVKAIAKAKGFVVHDDGKEPEPTTKKCPYCKTEIAIDATRCPHCTSELE